MVFYKQIAAIASGEGQRRLLQPVRLSATGCLVWQIWGIFGHSWKTKSQEPTFPARVQCFPRRSGNNTRVEVVLRQECPSCSFRMSKNLMYCPKSSGWGGGLVVVEKHFTFLLMVVLCMKSNHLASKNYFLLPKPKGGC